MRAFSEGQPMKSHTPIRKRKAEALFEEIHHALRVEIELMFNSVTITTSAIEYQGGLYSLDILIFKDSFRILSWFMTHRNEKNEFLLCLSSESVKREELFEAIRRALAEVSAHHLTSSSVVGES